NGTTSHTGLCTAAYRNVGRVSVPAQAGPRNASPPASAGADRPSGDRAPRMKNQARGRYRPAKKEAPMAKYAIGNDLGGAQQSLPATYKTLVSMFATTGSLRRGKLYDILIGTNGTPADNYVEWDVSRMTADGTGTAITPAALDPADAAALGTSKANYTAEG